MIDLPQRLSRSRAVAQISRLVARGIPPAGPLHKFRNLLAAADSIARAEPVIGTRPVTVRIAPTTLCNYRCLFCEIHQSNRLFPHRPANTVDLDVIRRYEGCLSSALYLSFYGGAEEPLLDPHFAEIVRYLKSRYGTRMMVNTNASLLKPELADLLVEIGFDLLLVSYHAGSASAYEELMTGDIERVDEHLRYLQAAKRRAGRGRPIVDFNFALQKLNVGEFRAILDKAKALGAARVIVNRYYGGGNVLQDRKAAYDYDVAAGNKALDEIYAYGRQTGVRLSPERPAYWTDRPGKWDPADIDRSRRCELPWVNLHFNPVLSEKNCHYVGVCNRINLFKVAYDQVSLRTENELGRLWNHPVLQYLRTTVNAPELNPICRFCKNRGRETLRCVDNARYLAERDEAVKGFFAEFRGRHSCPSVDGLTVLEDNPYGHEKAPAPAGADRS